MVAYAVVRVTVTDPEKYQNYMALTPGAIAAHGGRFLTRGGALEVLEGEAEDRRMVLVEFPSMDAARTFYNSPEYAEAKAARAGAAEMQFIILEGL